MSDDVRRCSASTPMRYWRRPATPGARLPRSGDRAPSRGEVIERGCDAAARERNARRRQAHLDAAQRARQHQIVEVAEMADAEDFSLQSSEPGAERHGEALEDDRSQRVGIAP